MTTVKCILDPISHWPWWPPFHFCLIFYLAPPETGGDGDPKHFFWLPCFFPLSFLSVLSFIIQSTLLLVVLCNCFGSCRLRWCEFSVEAGPLENIWEEDQGNGKQEGHGGGRSLVMESVQDQCCQISQPGQRANGRRFAGGCLRTIAWTSQPPHVVTVHEQKVVHNNYKETLWYLEWYSSVP
jgi:hypothetical protein